MTFAKREDNLKSIFKTFTIIDVLNAHNRAASITQHNKSFHNEIFTYKYGYYEENPSLSWHEIRELIFKEIKIKF